MGDLDATALDISADVRSGRRSAEQVVSAHLDRIRVEDRRWGAFRVVRHEAALAEARALDAAASLGHLPLAGVPVAIKDNVAVAGEITTHGTAAVRDLAPATADHPVVARLRAAGAIVVGITRVPELCLYAFTDGPQAITRNPWDPARTTGGSSGGSAAAVAAGMVPIAHGADGLGSLRIPAATCGLVTLKPGRGVVPAGLGAGDWFGMSENGILATTVDDLALGHSVLAAIDSAAIDSATDDLRIGTSTRSPLAGTRPDADSRSAVDRAGAALASLGHRVRPVQVHYPPSAALALTLRWCAVAAADAAHLGADPALLQSRTRRHTQLGRLATRMGLVRPEPVRAFTSHLQELFEHVDILLTPVSLRSPPPALDWHRRAWLTNVQTSVRYAPYPSVWNYARYPAMSIPMGTRSDGLPLGLQMVGPPGSEQRLLGVAVALQRELPWQRHAASRQVARRSM